MKVTTSTGAIETNELSTKVNINMVKLEEAARNNPLSIDNFPIGYVIPLGTLGNAQNQQEQFSSNFHLVAYTIAKDLRDLSIDFSDFNVNTDQNAQGQVLKLQKRLDELAIRSLGDNWRVTIFNVSLQTTIDSMCKSRQDVDAMAKAIEDAIAALEKKPITVPETPKDPQDEETEDPADTAAGTMTAGWASLVLGSLGAGAYLIVRRRETKA